MYTLNFIDDLEKFFQPVRDFINNHYDNPFFWLAIIGFALGIFLITYSALHKGE